MLKNTFHHINQKNNNKCYIKFILKSKKLKKAQKLISLITKNEMIDLIILIFQQSKFLFQDFNQHI